MAKIKAQFDPVLLERSVSQVFTYSYRRNEWEFEIYSDQPWEYIVKVFWYKDSKKPKQLLKRTTRSLSEAIAVIETFSKDWEGNDES